jgi:hypothetical protein
MKPLHSKRHARKEEDMQMALSKYIMLMFPDVIFTAEASGVRTSYVQAAKMKMMRSHGCHLDMIILEPRGLYAGLILELKHEDKSPFLQNGSISKKEHVQAQAAMVNRLKNKGYYSSFAVGLDQGIAIINHYMNQPPYGIAQQRQRDPEVVPENGREK